MPPSERTQTIPILTIFEIELVSLAFYGIFTEYSPEGQIIPSSTPEHYIYHIYGLFQDIHVMMFIGFGFLMTFLKKYWFSSLGMNFWLAALALQWSILIDGFFERLLTNDLEHWHTPIQIDVKSLVNADFAAASILICFGAVLGKVTFNQMTMLAFLQLIFYSLNLFIGVVHLKITDIGGSMVIHTFGAYFGLSASKVLTNKKTLINSADVQGSNYTSDLFSMIGTIFLWMYWPSFNGAMAVFDARERVVINTILSLTHSCLFAFIVSRMVNPEEKFDMIHIQNSTLAGGVAIGAVADLPIMASSAMIIGGFAGVVSVLGYKYLQPFIEKKIGLHDTCGVHNLHGMPGIIGGIASSIAAAAASYEDYGEKLYKFFPETKNGRTLVEQGGYQILYLVITLVLAMLSGKISGHIVKTLMKSPEKYFQDELNWEGAEGYIPVKKPAMNSEEIYKLEEKVIEENAVTRHHKPTMLFQPNQFIELQTFDKAKSMKEKKNKENLYKENIQIVEEFIHQKSSENEQKDMIFEKQEFKSPDKEQKLESPALYSKFKGKE